MEMELEPRVTALPYKIKATSRESPAQKAVHVLDSDLRTHWSTATNTKEWILLELDEACLLSHIRIYNKSVLEWEISVGLRYKPETFVKVRPRCEAPRRDMIYPMNYTPCRYVRISCLRGNPIAVFFIQLIGVSVSGLEPEFQPVVSYLLPHIISHKQEAHDMYLQLLQDMASRLLFFLPHFEADLANFSDAAESDIRFFAMLAGPFYPILHVVKEREAAKPLPNIPDSDAFRINQTSTLTVSSNFEAQPRRSRSPSPFIQPASSSIAFHTDAILMLLKKAYRDSDLRVVCRTASRALQKLIEPIKSLEDSLSSGGLASSSVSDDIAKTDALSHVNIADYSCLFGEEFMIPDDHWDTAYTNILDIGAVEEGIIHVLYACASQPLLCCKLADSNSDFWSILPLVQALLPALRPPVNGHDQVDDTFSQWKHASVQHALFQIVTVSSSAVYRPLLRACAGYLSSFSVSQVKAACVLIDLCSGPFSPWISTVIAKVDLAIELMEDLLGVIQAAPQSIARARAALKYIILALSGHMDDVLAKCKENKHKLLFLLEMLEPFLDPVIKAMKKTAFGDVSAIFLEKQERTCAIALNVIRTAAQRASILPSLESEWRRGSVAPSVLLSILGPHMPLPADIDLCKWSTSKAIDQESFSVSTGFSIHPHEVSSKINNPGESDEKIDVSEASVKIDVFEDTNLLFAPTELKKTVLTSLSNHLMGNSPDKNLESSDCSAEVKHITENWSSYFQLDDGFLVDYFNLQADYLQLVHHQECQLRASEFQHLALDLCSQHDIPPEGHDAAIDALLLAAECYVNPFFMLSFRPTSRLISQIEAMKAKTKQNNDIKELGKDFQKKKNDLEKVAYLEAERDKTVLELLLQAAKLDREYQVNASQGKPYPCDSDGRQPGINTPPLDTQSADAVTLVRQNQALLCHFVMQQLQREQHTSHEILLQTLLFILHSATDLFCPPEDVIDIILQSAENLNGIFTLLYCQLKEGNSNFDPEKLHLVQRRWVLLRQLVIASSGSDDGVNLMGNLTKGFRYISLVPPSSWMSKISKFSNNACPLPRFLGWMAVSRYAKQYLKEQLFFASDLSQLTLLLSIFSDELASADSITKRKVKASEPEQFYDKHYGRTEEIGLPDQSSVLQSFRILHPELHKFFPSMKKQFGTFSEIILEAVGMQLKCLPCSAIPDVLCWFSDLCIWPFSETLKGHHSFTGAVDFSKGYATVNARAIVLYLLESIVSEHMEAMVPEMPRVAQILITLCRAPYCDVAFLDSVLCLLKPLISYFLTKSTDERKVLSDEFTYLDFESNFEELFDSICCRKICPDFTGEKRLQGSLMIFILGGLFPDLSSSRRRNVLHSLQEWVDFTVSEPTSSFYNYLCAFQKVLDSCHMLLVQSLNPYGILMPFKKNEVFDPIIKSPDGISTSIPISSDCAGLSSLNWFAEEVDDDVVGDSSDHGAHHLSAEDMKEFSEELEILILKLIPAIEVSWKLHYQLAMKLALKSAKCFFFLKFLCSVSQLCAVPRDADGGSIDLPLGSDLASKHWRDSLEGFTGAIMTVEQNQCWHVASTMLDYLLRLPQAISLDSVICSLCSAIKHLLHHAPRISWRLQVDNWLSLLFMRGIGDLDGNESSLVDLFSAMLGHAEPEQRSIALQHLGRLVGLDTYDGVVGVSNTFQQNGAACHSFISVPEPIISFLVLNTWDSVAALAFSDPSIFLRSHATALLSGYIPFAGRTQLQSFLVAANTILQGMGWFSPSMAEGHLTRLSLGLLASACLHSPVEDIALIPENVWQNLESMGMSRNGWLDDREKKMCQALCRLKIESSDAKEALKEAFSSNTAVKHSDPDFKSTRESILQVLSSLTSVQSYFDFFSNRIDQESQELEEAEIEMELLQKEKALQEVSGNSQEALMLPNISNDKDNSRLQQIKNDIQSLERSKLREEIAILRQKKLLMRRDRHKYLEEAASREMELLQEIDRQRTDERARAIERQRLLELERAKTRELQFNLDMEKERQTQKDVQRELEQVESGVRSSRREFSSNPNSRPRDRYRERDNGRSGHDGSSRGRESGSSQTATSGPSATSPAPTVVLAGSRSFSGHLPTILQARDRTEERNTAYEDSFEGSRDSGDASSMGDPELASAFDGLTGGFGSATRHGSRGSKSRQIAERRERDGRDGRREGKWERKHS